MSTVPGAHDPGRPLSHLASVADALDSPSPHGSSVVTRAPSHPLAAACVVVDPKFWPERSDKNRSLFAFVYKVRIQNVGEVAFTIRRRRWEIIDALAERKIVQGDGVVGQQPSLSPGESFEYASFCPIDTRWGTMEGHYTLELPDGSAFDARIGRFFLIGPEL